MIYFLNYCLEFLDLVIWILLGCLVFAVVLVWGAFSQCRHGREPSARASRSLLLHWMSLNDRAYGLTCTFQQQRAALAEDESSYQAIFREQASYPR